MVPPCAPVSRASAVPTKTVLIAAMVTVVALALISAGITYALRERMSPSEQVTTTKNSSSPTAQTEKDMFVETTTAKSVPTSTTAAPTIEALATVESTSTVATTDDLASACAELICNNGRCMGSAQGATCICDEGFLEPHCDQQGSDFYRRTLLMHGLADPDILAVNDDLFYLTGSSDSEVLPIHQSIDLLNFSLKYIYDPSAIDPIYDYCSILAPDLLKRGTGYDLYFSAQRVWKGASCPANGQDDTTFLSRSFDDNLRFGAPILVIFGDKAPKGRIAAGCHDNICMKIVRIECAVVGPENDRWYFYVWFLEGHIGYNIASFPFASSISLVANAGPVSFHLPSSDELFNGAPEVFWRNGQYYFFFSTSLSWRQFAMSYIMAPSISDLTRKRMIRTHSIAQRDSAGKLVQNHGHNSIVARRGQFFNVFHQGIFDSRGYLISRSTYKQRLAFRSDGSIQTLNTVDIRWTEIPSHKYSIDIVKKDGSVIGPCISASHIGFSLETTYAGVCPNGGDQLVDKYDIAAFRLYYAINDAWGDFVEERYDGFSDKIAIYLPNGLVKQIIIRWNERLTGTKYSLDIGRGDGTWIAPCVNDHLIGSNIQYIFDGKCVTPGITVDLRDIASIRVCSAILNDWSRPICGSVDYDGETIYVSLTI